MNNTTQKIEIVGNQVSILETNVVRTVSLQDFARTMQNPGQFRTGALPRHCVDLDNRERSNTSVVYRALIQYPSEIKTLRHDEGEVEVLVPSRVYMVRVEQSNGIRYPYVYQYFAKDWVGKDLSAARVYHSWLPNRYSGGDLCLGSAGADFTNMDIPLAARVDRGLQETESAVYNNDLPECLDYRPSTWIDFCDWSWDREYDEEMDDYEWCAFNQLLLPWSAWYTSSEENQTIHAVHDLLRDSRPLSDYWV